MQRAVRNLGREGLAATAISAVDAALYDLKARLLGLPLVAIAGQLSGCRADLWKRRLHQLLTTPNSRVSSGAGCGQTAALGQDEDRHPSGTRSAAGRAPKRRSATASLFVDANGAYAVKQALTLRQAFRRNQDVRLVRGAGVFR